MNCVPSNPILYLSSILRKMVKGAHECTFDDNEGCVT